MLMRQKRFDPHKFIDRDFEQELFEELLKGKDEARILAIKDDGGMGKSHLLRRFQYRCRIVKPRTPVSLVALDQLPDDSPLALVQQIAQNLEEPFSIPFPTFTYFENARKDHDFTTIRGRPLSGSVDLSGADMRHAENIYASGIMTNIQNVDQVNVTGSRPELTAEQEAEAQKVSVYAFFKDLTEYCRQQPVVLMLDAYEKCSSALQQWLAKRLLERHYFDFDQRPEHLLLVIAGRKLPYFEDHWSEEDCETVVKSVKSLSKWTAEHVEECLRVHKFKYTQPQLETFIGMIEIGLPPSQVVQGMQLLLAVGSR